MKILITCSIYIIGLVIFLWINNKIIDKDELNQFMRNFTVVFVSILWPLSWWINIACWYSEKINKKSI